MTDRIRHLTITLDEDTRDDELESIVYAIERVRGVANVLPNSVTMQDLLARQAVRAEVQRQLHAAIENAFLHDQRTQTKER